MGLRDWIVRQLGGGDTRETTYILKRQTEKGGMAKVMDLAGPTPLEELFPHLEPGIYALHSYTKGTPGFKVVWGNMEVTGETPTDAVQPRSARGESAMVTFAGFAKELSQLRADAEEEFKLLAPLFGMSGGTGDPKTFIEQMEEAKGQHETLERFFGDKTTGEEAIKYDGTVPIWLHPKLIPELLDTSLEKIERRLTKWGVVDEESDKREPEDDLPPFPPKPPSKSPPDEPEDVKFTPDELEDVETETEGVEGVEKAEEE